MEEKIEIKSEDAEVIKEEAKLEKPARNATHSVAGGEDPSKALKSWFEKKPEEGKKEEDQTLRPVRNESSKHVSKKPINWRKFRFISIHILAILVLVASVGANILL